MDMQKTENTITSLKENIQCVIKCNDAFLNPFLAAFFCGGHILLEDFPGTGKTTLAKSLARSIQSDFKRIQFTPDLLPGDIIGVSIFNQKKQTFEIHKGPVFTDILLSDEINRASPRTQSALLEAMAENQVSIDGEPFFLNKLFFVIATQNPVESRGTYPLPESQMDRFMVRLSLGYADHQQEIEILSSQKEGHPLNALSSVARAEDILLLRKQIQSVRISREILYYIVDLTSRTRSYAGVALGASTRASIALMQLSQALAFISRYDFVTPDFVQQAAPHVLSHRIVLDAQATYQGLTPHGVVQQILSTTPLPK